MHDLDDLPQGDPKAFALWREAVGFEDGFPRLRALREPAPRRDRFGHETPTRDSAKFFLNQMHREKLMDIRESLAGRSLVVTTAPGHGATTLARYLYLEAEKDAVVRKAIPVFTSLEDMLPEHDYTKLAQMEFDLLSDLHSLSRRHFCADPEEVMEAADEAAAQLFGKLTARRIAAQIESDVRLAVVRSLVLSRWEHVLSKSLYRDLLGTSIATDEAFEARRAELAPIVKGPVGDAQWELIASVAGQLGSEDYQAIIRELNREGNVRIRLMLDLSATPMGRQYLGDSRKDVDEHGEYPAQPYVDALKAVTKAVKNVEERSAGGPQPTLPSLLDKAYFLNRQAWRQLDADFTKQVDSVIDFPPYRAVDVFAMLAYHYPPSWDDHGGRVELLSAVLDSEFIEIGEDTALSTEMVLLECQLRARLSDRKAVNYHQRQRAPSDPDVAALQADMTVLRKRMDEMAGGN